MATRQHLCFSWDEIQKILVKLPKDERRIVSLILGQGMTHHQVAVNLDLTKSHVYKVYNRGIARIKTAMLHPAKTPQSVLYYEKVSGELKQTLENKLGDALTRENFLKERIKRLEKRLVRFAEYERVRRSDKIDLDSDITGNWLG